MIAVSPLLARLKMHLGTVLSTERGCPQPQRVPTHFPQWNQWIRPPRIVPRAAEARRAPGTVPKCNPQPPPVALLPTHYLRRCGVSRNGYGINGVRNVALTSVLLILLLGLLHAPAGDSGLNVVVVVNQHDTNSVQLGNYYCEKRQVPPQNVLRINWSGTFNVWGEFDYTNTLYNPLHAMLASRQLTNQVDTVVLSMTIPYQVDLGANGFVSTTASVFYGLKPDPNPPCSLAGGSSNRYAGSEGVFRQAPPISASSNSWLVTMITASNLPAAKQIVDSGVAGDSTFPTQTVYFEKTSDVDRNVRYLTFDTALFDTRLRGDPNVQRTNADEVANFGTILGFQTGRYNFSLGLDGVTMVPGSLADNLTSYGGLILVPAAGQQSVLTFTAAGAAGAYGTVTEPCNYLEKFPSPNIYFYQARGFNLAECYYMGVTNPYQGLVLGDPLSAPFANPASGGWTNLAENALLGGTTNLSLRFIASATNTPVRQVDLFVDGLFAQTLTNLPPYTNNILSVTINGQATNFTIPAGSTLKSIASNLTSRLNQNSYSNLTKVRATMHGDRIELKSLDITRLGPQTSLAVSNSIGAGLLRTTGISSTGTNFLDSPAFGLHNLVVNSGITYPPPNGSWILLTVTKTNGTVITVGSTNNATITNIVLLVQDLVGRINSDPQLSQPDGCIAEDFVDYSQHVNPFSHAAEFNLRARTAGWSASQIQASLTGSSPLVFTITPAGTSAIDDNVSDLQPRAHLYVTAGLTNLTATFPLNTTTLADGFHELTAVAYEGSHVRTQKRVARNVLIKNTSLSATFTLLAGGTNTAVESTLQFRVVANTNNISRIELFSTGGSLTNITGQSNVLFSVAGSNLDVGLHTFYAIVTDTGGRQYRTETKWIRLVGQEVPFTLSILEPPLRLTWPATAGRPYEVLSATNVTNSFLLRDTITPSNSTAIWLETNAAPGQQYYRVRTAN